jgi:signal transduction histidine kinase
MNHSTAAPRAPIATRSIRTRLLIALCALLALGATNIAVAYWGARQREHVSAQLQRAVTRQTVMMEVADQLKDRYQQVRLLSDLIGPEATVGSAEEQRTTAAAIDVIPRRLDALVEAADPDHRPAVVGLREEVETLAESWKRFYEYQSRDPEAAISELVLRAEPLAEELLTTKLPAAVRREKGELARANRAFVLTDRTSSRVAWVIFLITGSLGSILVYAAMRDLLIAVDALKDGAERIGAGEFGHRIEILNQDELGEVATSFNQMASGLQVAQGELEVRNAELADTLGRLQEAQQELVQNEKLSAMGGMLAGLAHELNNPLASVLGYGELLHARLAESADPEIRAAGSELVEPLVGEAIRARVLVRDLLHFSRKSAPALEVVDLGDAVRLAVNLRSYAFSQAGLSLVVDVQPGLAVRAEGQRLQQVFMNVLNNAFDALVGGGGTRLSIRAASPDAGWVVVEFEDDGPGLVQQERVFDPFYTTKAVGEGTGLGLTLVHRFVEEFGGSVTAFNGASGGACFVLRLPSAVLPQKPDAQPSRRRVRAAVPHDGPRRRVLVVEDEEALRNVQSRMLAKLDLDVLLASSGAEARELLGSGDVELVISDIKMPGEMDGVALFQWLNLNRPELAERFLFVTGDVHDPALLEMLASRPDRFLTKPFEMYEYMERVGQVLGASPAPQSPRP